MAPKIQAVAKAQEQHCRCTADVTNLAETVALNGMKQGSQAHRDACS